MGLCVQSWELNQPHTAMILDNIIQHEYYSNKPNDICIILQISMVLLL